MATKTAKKPRARRPAAKRPTREERFDAASGEELRRKIDASIAWFKERIH